MEMKLRDFLSEYGNSLKKKVIDSFKPLFNPNQKDSRDREAELRLEGLKRKPFPAQTRSSLALAKGFFVENKKGLVLVGEMGTGKTETAIAVSHLIPKRNYRVVVMCPPHLVQKWIREIEITLPKCKVVNLNGKGLKELEDLRHAGKPTCPEFYVIGRERAKGLLNGEKTQSVSEAWKRYKKAEIVTDSFIGDEIPEIETTTTTITKGDRSTSVTYERVIRGKVYPRNGYAVAYVDQHKFFLKAGKVLFNGRSCGSYDKKGMGDINKKPIQIMKAPDQSCYLLVELK
jgi:hypothetical protein